MSDAPVEFFYDFNSPYGYVAAHKIEAVAAKHGRTVDWKPFLLGAVFKVTGAVPLPHVPMKGDYARHDFARSARFHDVTYNPPADFPFSPVAASRAVYWAKADGKAGEMTLALYNAALGEAQDIASPDAVVAIAAKAGFDLLVEHVAYFHIKDAVAATGRVVPAGHGDGALEQILRAAVERGFSGFASIEPHLKADDPDFGGSGAERFATAVAALRSLLDRVER